MAINVTSPSPIVSWPITADEMPRTIQIPPAAASAPVTLHNSPWRCGCSAIQGGM